MNLEKREVKVECSECGDYEIEVTRRSKEGFPQNLEIFGVVLKEDVSWTTCPVCGGECDIYIDGEKREGLKSYFKAEAER